MARRNPFDLEILGSVSSKFEDFCSEVFEDGGHVDGGYGDVISRVALIVCKVYLEEPEARLRTR